MTNIFIQKIIMYSLKNKGSDMFISWIFFHEFECSSWLSKHLMLSLSHQGFYLDNTYPFATQLWHALDVLKSTHIQKMLNVHIYAISMFIVVLKSKIYSQKMHSLKITTKVH